MSTYYYIIADHRTDYSDMPEISGPLDGMYLFYDINTDKFIDATSIVDLADTNNRIFSMALWNTKKYDNDDPNELPSWYYDPYYTPLGRPYIEELDHDNGWRDVFNVTTKRNRALIQLYNCATKIELLDDQKLGHNTMVRLSDISDNPHFKTDPLLYVLGIDGTATFYFSPNAKSGSLRCYLMDDYEKMSVKNPDWDSNKTTALSPPDEDGWRRVINAEYNGIEFDFYPNGCTNYWNMLEGIGNGIKIRFLDKNNNPLPYSAWYPAAMNILSGKGVYSSIGSTVNVFKVEARYINPIIQDSMTQPDPSLPSSPDSPVLPAYNFTELKSRLKKEYVLNETDRELVNDDGNNRWIYDVSLNPTTLEIYITLRLYSVFNSSSGDWVDVVDYTTVPIPSRRVISPIKYLD